MYAVLTSLKLGSALTSPLRASMAVLASSRSRARSSLALRTARGEQSVKLPRKTTERSKGRRKFMSFKTSQRRWGSRTSPGRSYHCWRRSMNLSRFCRFYDSGELIAARGKRPAILCSYSGSKSAIIGGESDLALPVSTGTR